MIHWKKNLYIIWFVQILSLMSFGFGLPFIPYYIQELGVTDPVKLKLFTGILNTTPAITMGIMAPLWGYLSDRLGKKLMLLRAVISGAIILTALGLSTSIWHVIFLRTLQGFLTGTVTAASALVASNTPDNKLSYALGFLSSSTFIGFSAGPALGGIVADSVGYRASFFIGASILLFDFFLILFMVKENRELLNKNKNNAECRFTQKNKKHNTRESIRQFKSLFTISIVSMLFILFFMRISRSVISPYLPLYVQEVRNTIQGSSRITGFINATIGLSTAISGIFLSRLGDKFDRLKLIKLCIIPGILLSIPLILINNLIIFSLLMGIIFFTIGGIEPVVMSITSQQISPDKRGSLFGIQALVGCIGWALSPMLGSIVSINYSTRSIFILIPIFLIFTLLTIIIYTTKRSKVKNTAKNHFS